jgi:hypothetical protein
MCPPLVTVVVTAKKSLFSLVIRRIDVLHYLVDVFLQNGYFQSGLNDILTDQTTQKKPVTGTEAQYLTLNLRMSNLSYKICLKMRMDNLSYNIGH